MIYDDTDEDDHDDEDDDDEAFLSGLKSHKRVFQCDSYRGWLQV